MRLEEGYFSGVEFQWNNISSLKNVCRTDFVIPFMDEKSVKISCNLKWRSKHTTLSSRRWDFTSCFKPSVSSMLFLCGNITKCHQCFPKPNQAIFVPTIITRPRASNWWRIKPGYDVKGVWLNGIMWRAEDQNPNRYRVREETSTMEVSSCTTNLA